MTKASKGPAPGKRISTWKIMALVLLTVVLSVSITLWVVLTFVFPARFEPVTLNQKEAQALEQKLDRLDPATRRTAPGRRPPPENGAPLTPERYSEEGATREITLSERELNALLATNTNLAQRLAIDLSDDLASAKLLVPVDPDFPILGGKTVRVTAGLEVHFSSGRPVVILKGVSLWGVPLPNAWLGNLKNIDLVQQFGAAEGFWQAFAEGIEEIEVSEGQLRLKLRE